MGALLARHAYEAKRLRHNLIRQHFLQVLQNNDEGLGRNDVSVYHVEGIRCLALTPL